MHARGNIWRLSAGLLVGACLVVAGLVPAGPLWACPFCTTIKPTLAQQRETSAVLALGESLPAQEKMRSFRLHHVAVGGSRFSKGQVLAIPSNLELKPGSLVLLIAQMGEGEQLDWTIAPISDLAYAYLGKAPSLRMAPEERLKYFARYLEHEDAQIAEDAYLEFAHAPFDVVAKVSGALDSQDLRDWLVSEGVPQERKGLYGLCLGLRAASTADADERAQNRQLLRKLVTEPGSDFRAFLDGVMGGFLVAEGDEGLKVIEEKFLANAQAANGHVRHAMTALRFYHEYGKGIPLPRLRSAMRHLLARPEFAAAAITDLARLEDWDCAGDVAALYGRKDYDDLPTRKAIVQFLLLCPTDEAAASVQRLRKDQPDFIGAVERQLQLQGGVK